MLKKIAKIPIYGRTTQNPFIVVQKDIFAKEICLSADKKSREPLLGHLRVNNHGIASQLKYSGIERAEAPTADRAGIGKKPGALVFRSQDQSCF